MEPELEFWGSSYLIEIAKDANSGRFTSRKACSGERFKVQFC